jgi:hypothetical protein
MARSTPTRNWHPEKVQTCLEQADRRTTVAHQHTVRALVERDAAPQLRRELIDGFDVTPDDVTISPPQPARYRDEAPDAEVGRYVAGGSKRTVLGAIAGAAIALVVVLVIPVLREWLPFSLILLFGGAWGGGITATARFMQTHKDESALGDRVHDVSPQDAEHLRLLTVTVARDRDDVAELLSARGATLLDSWQPQVGREPSSPRHDIADVDDVTGRRDHPESGPR